MQTTNHTTTMNTTITHTTVALKFFTPCLDLTEITAKATTFRRLIEWHEDPVFHSPSGTSPTEFRRLVWKELAARTRQRAATKRVSWRSTGEVFQVGPPVASFRF
jgi:hypothetical protein